MSTIMSCSSDEDRLDPPLDKEASQQLTTESTQSSNSKSKQRPLVVSEYDGSNEARSNYSHDVCVYNLLHLLCIIDSLQLFSEMALRIFRPENLDEFSLQRNIAAQE